MNRTSWPKVFRTPNGELQSPSGCTGSGLALALQVHLADKQFTFFALPCFWRFVGAEAKDWLSIQETNKFLKLTQLARLTCSPQRHRLFVAPLKGILRSTSAGIWAPDWRLSKWQSNTADTETHTPYTPYTRTPREQCSMLVVSRYVYMSLGPLLKVLILRKRKESGRRSG